MFKKYTYFFILRLFFLFLFLLFLFSCSTVNDGCVDGDSFDLKINGNLNKINYKILLDGIINNSGINININSNYIIKLDVSVVVKTSFLSINNDIEGQTINYIVKYSIFNKNNNMVIDSGKIIISDDLDISDDRFSNFATNNYITNNFVRNLSIRLEKIIENILINKKCKKLQNQVAIYYFNVNLNTRNARGSYYV